VRQRPHRWEYCANCKSDMVVCGKCGNNCCNGGSNDGCPDRCAEAYALQDSGQGRMDARRRNAEAARAWLRRGRVSPAMAEFGTPPAPPQPNGPTDAARKE
jgi:hypothetical protein